MTDTEQIVRRFIGGDTAGLAERAKTSDDPTILVAAALLDPSLLPRAAAVATTARDRQLVAIATAHLAGDTDRVRDLARDHLADHPDSLLAAWIASSPRSST